MQNVRFDDFVGYIESLAVRHEDIQHTKEGISHFTRLDTDELDTSLQARVGFPVLCLDRYAAQITGADGNRQKRRGITLMFLEHVPDAKDYNRIHDVWDNCEAIADDFVAQIYRDAMDTGVPGINDIDLSSAEYELAANRGLNLYGVIVTFPVLTAFCAKPRTGKFQ
jgi:hypothetical protein